MDRNNLLLHAPFLFIIWFKNIIFFWSDVYFSSCWQKMNWTKYSKTKDGFVLKDQVNNCWRYKLPGISSFYKLKLIITSICACYLFMGYTEKLAFRQLNILEKTLVNLCNFFIDKP